MAKFFCSQRLDFAHVIWSNTICVKSETKIKTCNIYSTWLKKGYGRNKKSFPLVSNIILGVKRYLLKHQQEFSFIKKRKTMATILGKYLGTYTISDLTDEQMIHLTLSGEASSIKSKYIFVLATLKFETFTLLLTESVK